MKKYLILPLMVCLVALSGCGNRRTVNELESAASIELDESIYGAEAESEEADAAKECRDYLAGNNGIKQDYNKAAEVIKPYENSNNADVLYCLGIMHYYAYGISMDEELAYKYLLEAEKGGNYYASIILGFIYESGSSQLDIDRDYDIARDYFRRAILNGVVEGYYGLGGLYADGLGMDIDVDTAEEYYQKVIDEGEDVLFINRAINAIGNMYYSGNKRDNTDEDDDPEYEKAVEWYQKTADLGDSAGLNWMGYFYRDGIGVEADIDKSLECYEQSSDIGNVNSMRALGWIYAYGELVDEDGEKALSYFQRAADLNDPNALFAIGQLYDGGISVEQDKDKAQEYYTLAYEAGYED